MGREAIKISGPARAILLGLAATAAVVAGHVMGYDQRLELQALDLRFRSFSRAAADDAILHVDIDDRSLEQIGRWPWPRRQQAGIVEVLQRCGARAVVLDIILPEPQELRYESAADEIYASGGGELLGAGAPLRVFDDAELSEVLGKYSNVCLPMHIDFADLPTDSVEARLEASVSAILSAAPTASLKAVEDRVRSDLGSAAEPDDVAKAYLRARAIRALLRFGLPLEAASDYPAARGRLIPPLVLFANAIRSTGFVTFRPDIDGVVRRIPLLARSADRVWPQFALAAAAAELGRRGDGEVQVRADAGAVTITCGRAFSRRVPVDEDGFMLINWASARPGGSRDAGHISAAAVGRISQLERSLLQIQRLRRLYQLELARKLGQEDLLELFARVDQLYVREVQWRIRRQQASLYRPGEPAAPPSCDFVLAQKELEGQIDALAAELFDDFYLQGASADAKAEVLELRRKLKALPQRAAAVHAQLIDSATALHEIVKGKLCLIGSTATGAADFVPTPISPRAPGVVVHANILNTILTGSFIRRAGLGLDVAAIVLAGGAVAFLAATRPVLLAGPLTILLAGAYAAVNAAVVFAVGGLWVVVVGPLMAMAASFVVVTAYRQLTEERAKRRIRSLFAHALSPALVDRLIDDPSVAKLGGERRVLTFLFSDLQGFTPMAEALGEQQTVHLLNHYFDHMTEVIQNRCGGYLNKFLGDGLFVFFGAPVFQEDHAARAIRAALQCQAEVERLNGELAGQYTPPVWLSCRIGLATGEVMVGNCGSTQRMDYTAIGDAVNLASRLESANKSFGTRILAAGQTWAGRDGAVLARPLGKIRVVGKTEPVEVFNILAEGREADDVLRRRCDEFAAAVKAFGERRFAEAAEAFEALAAADPHDKAAGLYLSLCKHYLADPPPTGWDGALELTEK